MTTEVQAPDLQQKHKVCDGVKHICEHNTISKFVFGGLSLSISLCKSSYEADLTVSVAGME